MAGPLYGPMEKPPSLAKYRDDFAMKQPSSLGDPNIAAAYADAQGPAFAPEAPAQRQARRVAPANWNGKGFTGDPGPVAAPSGEDLNALWNASEPLSPAQSGAQPRVGAPTPRPDASSAPPRLTTGHPRMGDDGSIYMHGQDGKLYRLKVQDPSVVLRAGEPSMIRRR